MNREPESRAPAADKARHRRQDRFSSLIALSRHLLDDRFRPAHGLFGRFNRRVLGEPDIYIGDVEILAREKLVMKLAAEVAAEDQQDRKARQRFPAMVDRKTGDPAIPPPEPFLPQLVGGCLGLRT